MSRSLGRSQSELEPRLVGGDETTVWGARARAKGVEHQARVSGMRFSSGKKQYIFALMTM